jgi:hypothetical protein
MKSKPQVTKAAQAKIEAMKQLKAAYSQAKAQGTVRSYEVSPA